MDVPSIAIQVGSGGMFAVIATYFIKRYISINDLEIKRLNNSIQYHTDRLLTYSKEISEHKIEVLKSISGTRDNFRDIEEKVLAKMTQVLIDLKETRTLLDQVIDEQKTKKNDDKDLHGKIIWIVNKIPLIESQYQDILNALHRRNR